MAFNAIIVGLGNPGPRYLFTRHNIGFILLDLLAQEAGVKFSTKGFAKNIQAEGCEVNRGGKNLLCLKPQTFMNLSGESLERLYQEQNHLRELPLIVVHDEVDLPLGKIRIKLGGGDAGHNGLKSIREKLGHGEFFRLRLGVGRPAPDSQMQVRDYVLENFSKEEEPKLIDELHHGVAVIQTLLNKDLLAAQTLASKENFDLKDKGR